MVDDEVDEVPEGGSQGVSFLRLFLIFLFFPPLFL